jgi:heme-degrading monooxygenase HmoA
MIAVIFEVQPRTGRFDDYLALAKTLRPRLDAIDGFIDIDRLGSKRTDGRVLSLSIFRDDKAVTRWRTNSEHHGAQGRGRFEIFQDYRLRVGEIFVDTAPPQGHAVVQQRFDATEVGDAKVVTISEIVTEPGTRGPAPDALASLLALRPATPGLIDSEAFESISTPGKLLLLAGWRDPDAAAAWSPARPGAARSLRHRQVRVLRDYGLFDRREAPQYYPDVKREGAHADGDETRRQAAGR